MSPTNDHPTPDAKTAIVTGAASGIGCETCRVLSRQGFAVVGFDANQAGLERLEAAERTACVDVSDTDAVAAAVQAEVDRCGRIDVLANVAGIGSTQTVVDTPPDLWEAVFAVNVRGIFNTSRAVLPHMIERGSGAVVNVASVAGMIGLPNRAAYCASKGAVIALTRAMAIDHVRQGIRVNCVCPGTIETPWVHRLIDDAADPQAARAELVSRQPMERLGRPEDVAAAVAYLVSDAAAFITGIELVIDGGLTAA